MGNSFLEIGMYLLLVFFACKEPSLFHISSKKGNSLQPGSTRVIFPNCKVHFTYYFEPVFACFSFLYLCLYVSKSYIVFYLLVHWWLLPWKMASSSHKSEVFSSFPKICSNNSFPINWKRKELGSFRYHCSICNHLYIINILLFTDTFYD